jgi:membrane protein YdbS with pleckstrin-like domain
VGFPAKLLNPGEEVAADLRPHWKFLFGPAAAVVVIAAASLVALAKSAPRWADLVLAATLVLSLFWLGGRWLRWATTSFVVTTQRLVVSKGAFRRVAREILINRLTDVSCRQTVFDRLLGCGDVLIESPGRDSPDVFPDLPRPMAVQNLISQLVAQADRAGYFARMPSLGPGQGDVGHGGGFLDAHASVADQLAQLGELRRQGVISRREFAAKKAELLSRM